jgi:hypothetical protein
MALQLSTLAEDLEKLCRNEAIPRHQTGEGLARATSGVLRHKRLRPGVVTRV